MFPSLAEQHATQAAFLFQRREAAAGAAHYRLRDLAELDERLEAHLDGLRLSGAEGAAAARALTAAEEPGGVFVAADRALDAKDARALAQLLDLAGDDPRAEADLVGAIAWSPLERSAWAVRALLHASCPPALHRMGIAAKVAHREDPGEPLVHALWGDDPSLRRAGLFGLGRLGRRDLLSLAQEDYAQPDPAVRLEAATAGLLLGDRRGVGVLGELLASPLSYPALTLLARASDGQDGVRAIERLADAEPRAAIQAMEASLDVRWVPRLAAWLADPKLARLAARALATLTGRPVAGPSRGAAPDGWSSGPTDDPRDPDVAPDPDTALPWPAPEAYSAETLAATKGATGRWLWGAPLGQAVAERVLREGTQWERAAAAWELALASPGRPMVDVRAPGFRQE